MPMYWSMLAATAVFGGLSFLTTKTTIETPDGKIKKTRYIFAFLTFAYIAFFCCLRDEVQDTFAYINSFEAAPDKFSEILK